MTQQIDVPGVGIVEFPDTMDDDQIANAIKTNIIPNYQEKKKPKEIPIDRTKPALEQALQENPLIQGLQAVGAGAGKTISNTIGGLIDLAGRGVGAISPDTGKAIQDFAAKNQALTNETQAPYQEQYPISSYAGQAAGYAVPYLGALKGVKAVAPVIPGVRAFANPATSLGRAGEATLAGATVGGLGTIGDVGTRAEEAAIQGALGGAGELLLPWAGGVVKGAYNQFKGIEPPRMYNTRSGLADSGLPLNSNPASIPMTAPVREAFPGQASVPMPGTAGQQTGAQLYNYATSGRPFVDILGAKIPGIGEGLGRVAGEFLPGMKGPNIFQVAGNAVKQGWQSNKLQGLTGQTGSGLGGAALGSNRPGGPGGPGAAGPVNPATMAAQQINPVGQTPAAQAAINKSVQSAPPTPPAPKPTATLQPPVQQPTQVASPVAQAKETLVKSDPSLQRYTNDYVVPEHLEQPINNFTSGQQKNVLAMGEPGTGKSSLAGEWMAKNPNGRFDLVHTGTTPAELRNIIKNSQLSEKNLILVDEVGKMSPKMQEMISKEVGKLPNVQVLYTSNLPDMAKVHKSITGNPSINAPLQMSAELTPAQKQAYGLSVAERWDVKNLTPEQIAEKSLQGKNFRDIKRSVLEGTKVQETPLFEHEVKSIGLPESVATKIDNIVNNREGQRNLIIIDKAVLKKDPTLSATLNKLEGIGPIGENLTKDLVTSKTTSPIHRVQVLDKGDADKLSGLKGLIERSNESRYPTNIIVENHSGLKLDPALESRAVHITLDDLKAPATKEQQLAESWKNTPGYKAPKNVSQMIVPNEPPKTTGSTGLGIEVKLPEKQTFDPNNPNQSFEALTEMSPTEKRFRQLSQAELKVKKQILEMEMAKTKYADDIELYKNAIEIINRLLK